MAHFLPPEHVRQVNKLEWPYIKYHAEGGCEDLHYFQQLKVISKRVKSMGIKKNFPSLNSHIAQRGLSVRKAPKTALHDAIHL